MSTLAHYQLSGRRQINSIMKAASPFPQPESVNSSHKCFSLFQHEAKPAIFNRQQTYQDMPTGEHILSLFIAGAERHVNI